MGLINLFPFWMEKKYNSYFSELSLKKFASLCIDSFNQQLKKKKKTSKEAATKWVVSCAAR